MLKKNSLALLLILVLLGGYLWNKYGYLKQSFSNFPKSSTVPTAPQSLTPASSDPDLSYVHLASGLAISYYAEDIPGARSLAKGDTGVIYVGTRAQGVVYALVDDNQDGRADTRYVVASGLNNPNGVVYQDGNLYVAEIGRIIKFASIDTTYDKKPSYTTIYNDLPKETHHGWRYMALGPDNKLYLGIGAPCNTCEVQDPHGTISRINLDGSGFEVVARGIRNTVGFAWNPEDASLWFTDNGRDSLGEDIPRDELNQIRSEGTHFGFPYCHDQNVLDPQYGKGKNCADYEAPTLPLAPHAAALGMLFYQGDMFPKEFKNTILLAEHGSWNRKVPIGYRLMRVNVQNGVASSYQVFADGWLGSNGKALGRPVDILELADGSLLVSDDFAGAVYRITYRQP